MVKKNGDYSFSLIDFLEQFRSFYCDLFLAYSIVKRISGPLDLIFHKSYTMARRRWYRRYPRVVAAKKKWATNIIQSSVTLSGVAEICKNSVQSASVSPTPVILKCGNFRVQGDVLFAVTDISSNRPINLNFFLIFCPEGVAANNSLIGNHPEWIIGWKSIDVGIANTNQNAQGGTSFSLTTRLKRNLNSGDRIIGILQTTDTGIAANCTFTAQFWTCAN